MAETKTLTVDKLKKIINEELSTLKEEFEAKSLDGKGVDKTEADETEADELANTVEKKVDMVKALKIKEAKLRKALKETVQKKNNLLKTL